MTQEKGEQRYFPKPEELAILVPNLKEYFKLRERSNERKDLVNKTYELVKDLNPEHWSAAKVRLWFNNNKNVYLGKDQRRVPTPILGANKLNDPNADIVIEKTITPNNQSVDTQAGISPGTPSSTTGTSYGTPLGTPLEVVPPPPPQAIQTPNLVFSNQNQLSEINIPTDTKQFTDTSQLCDPTSSSTFSFTNSFSPSNSSIIQPIFSPFSGPNSSINFGLPPLSDRPFNEFEPTDKNQKEIDLPEIPDKSIDLDDQKYRLYDSIKAMHSYVIDISDFDPKNRLEHQKKLEDRMTEIYKQAHEDQQIPTILNNDLKCKQIKTPSTSNIQRQYSRTTRSYANDVVQDNSNIKYEEVSPHVFFPLRIKNKIKDSEPSNLLNILKGNCSIETLKPKSKIICASISESCDVAYVYLDELKHAYILSFKDKEIPTGFFMMPSSIYVDNIGSKIYVAGDCRIKSYKIPELIPEETFQVSIPNTIKSSCLTVCHRSEGSTLVFGCTGLILMWDVSFYKQPLQTQIKNSANKEIAESLSLDLSLIDWAKGRPSDSSFRPDKCIEQVTSLCPLGDYLAFASKKYHAIHLLDKDGVKVVGRLIGHTEGVTRLLRLNSKSFISSSKDFTLKIWDVDKMIATHQLLRHPAKITSVTSGTCEGEMLVFSGSKDGTTFLWAIERRLQTFELRLNEVDPSAGPFIPIEMQFDPQKARLTIVSKDLILNCSFKTQPGK